ncbi:MAG: hypothetical protein V2A73_18935, partial [Pseudomonadota bacterium]
MASTLPVAIKNPWLAILRWLRMDARRPSVPGRERTPTAELTPKAAIATQAPGRGVIVARWSPVDGGETRASAIPDVDVSRSDGHDKAPEGAQAVLGLW